MLFWLAGEASHAANATACDSCVALGLHTDDPVVPFNAPVWVRIDIRNLSGALQQGAVGPGSGYDFRIVGHTSHRPVPRLRNSTTAYDYLRSFLASSYMKEAGTLASVGFQLDQMYDFGRPGTYDVTGTGGSLRIKGNSVILPPSNTITITLKAAPPFSAAPTGALHDYDLRLEPDIQRFNGLFVLSLIRQMSAPNARACLRRIGNSIITLETFHTGALRAETSVKSCVDSLNGQAASMLGSSTGRVSISGARILAMILADERFNEAAFFATNDRDLAHYDVEVFARKGFIDVHFQPSFNATTVVWVGCPSLGTTSAGYHVEPKTYAVRSYNYVC